MKTTRLVLAAALVALAAACSSPTDTRIPQPDSGGHKEPPPSTGLVVPVHGAPAAHG